MSKLYLRFVDDAFIIWNGSNEKLSECLTYINQIRLSINFMEKEEKNPFGCHINIPKNPHPQGNTSQRTISLAP